MKGHQQQYSLGNIM